MGNTGSRALRWDWGQPSSSTRSAAYNTAVGQIVNALTGVGISAVTPVEDTIQPRLSGNPYKGLRAFTSADTDLFFGRDAFIRELLAVVPTLLTPITPKLLPIVNSSGSGKSSVVMAGLLPRLKRGAVSGSETWTYLEPVLPGAKPVESLASILYRALPCSTCPIAVSVLHCLILYQYTLGL
jgi:hypothetical protein